MALDSFKPASSMLQKKNTTAIAKKMNFHCVPRFRIYILKFSNVKMFSLYFNRIPEDVTSWVLIYASLSNFMVWVINVFLLTSFSQPPFPIQSSFHLSSQCHVVVSRAILVQSPGVRWWAWTIWSWLSSEITVCITLTNQLPKTILGNFILYKQLANESRWQLLYFCNIY